MPRRALVLVLLLAGCPARPAPTPTSDGRSAVPDAAPAPAPARIVLRNAFLIDCTGRPPTSGATVVVEAGRIARVVGPREAPPEARPDDVTLDLRGATLLPGLTDAHVHLVSAEVNSAELHRRMPVSLITVYAVRKLEQTLQQGFTTIRDAGGADAGLREAVERGLVAGPRVLVAGRPISQTGGHGDRRRPAEQGPPVEHPYGSIIADGLDEVRRAVREQLRRGVDQIKVHASGGAMSPADALESTQYSRAELEAIVEEARAAHTYVMAHAYSGAAVQIAVAAGVRSIEHGNLIDEPTARAMRQAGTFLVPTMITYEALLECGQACGLEPHQLAKLAAAREKSVASLRLAHAAGVKIASGSDLLGPQHHLQARELELKGQVLSPMEVLISATRTNAELFGLERELGTVEAGKAADLLVVKGNPLEDLRLFQDRDNLLVIMKGGKLYKNLMGPTE